MYIVGQMINKKNNISMSFMHMKVLSGDMHNGC